MSTRRAISLSGLAVPESVTAEAFGVMPGEVLVFRVSEQHPSPEMIDGLSQTVRETWPNNKAILIAGDMELAVLSFGSDEAFPVRRQSSVSISGHWG